MQNEYQLRLSKSAINIPQAGLGFEYGQFNSINNDVKWSVSQSLSFPTVYAKQKSVLKETYNSGMLNLVLKDNPEKLEATYGNLLPVMVKAIQELKAEKDELKNENNEMKQRLLNLEQTQNLLISKLEILKSNDKVIKQVKSGGVK